jgi:ribosomal protein S18 acetylase RimI-like enzyme
MIEIRCVVTPGDLKTVQALLQHYGAIPEVGVCVVGFAEEVAGLPGRYAEPDGTLLLASLDGRPVGCGALRKIGPGVCEMKRLYVDPAARGEGVGRALALRLIEEGRKRGYQIARLDTLPVMHSAIALYRSLGFHEIERYDSGSPQNAIYFELAF